jgi:hypothetical protein
MCVQYGSLKLAERCNKDLLSESRWGNQPVYDGPLPTQPYPLISPTPTQDHLACEVLLEMDDILSPLRQSAAAASCLPDTAAQPGHMPAAAASGLAAALAACTAVPGRLRARAADARLRWQAAEIAHQREELAQLRARLQALEAHLSPAPQPQPQRQQAPLEALPCG